MATGFAKPDGVYTLTDASWMAVMGDRPVDAMWVGPKTAKSLPPWTSSTVRQLADADAELLTSWVRARAGWRLLLLARGWRRRVSERHYNSTLPQPRRHAPTDLTDRAGWTPPSTISPPHHWPMWWRGPRHPRRGDR